MGVGGIGPRGPFQPEDHEPEATKGPAEAERVLPRSGVPAAAAGIVREARTRARDLLNAAESTFGARESRRTRAWGDVLRRGLGEVDVPRVMPLYGVGMPWPGGVPDRPGRPGIGEQRPAPEPPPVIMPLYGVPAPRPPGGGPGPAPAPEPEPFPDPGVIMPMYGVPAPWPPGGSPRPPAIDPDIPRIVPLYGVAMPRDDV